MAIRSITQRWIVNSLSIILAALILITIGISISVRNFYYNGVRQTLTAQANTIHGILLQRMNDSSFDANAELRRLVQNSDEKDKFEITAIDQNGRVAFSSSGFSYITYETMPDYRDATRSANGFGYYVGSSASGERIMALSMMIPSVAGKYSAVRLVTSLELIDQTITLIMLGVLVVVLAVIACVMISGFYFIKSIVIPVREVGAVARKYASGDMSTRLVKKSNDELGQLCDVINDMADELSATEELKNEFISSVSHELRTPLTAIKGWSETLLTLEESHQDYIMMKKGLAVIDNETQRLSGMVEELLDFSRMQSGRFTMNKAKMDLLAELGEAVLMYGERARRDGIALSYEEPEQVSPVWGDRNRLRQVFINIIDNALKYSDTGGQVDVTVREKDGWIIVAVADTGCGIAPEDLPKIKTKFYKANHSRRGSGIGLAVANEIVQAHDGELLIDSVLGEGTTVTIRLPIRKKKSERNKQETAAELFREEERNLSE